MVRKRVLIKAAASAGVELRSRCIGRPHWFSLRQERIRSKQQSWYSNLAKTTKKAIEVIGGRFEGQIYNAAQIGDVI